MRLSSLAVAMVTGLVMLPTGGAESAEPKEEASGCLQCHAGIEPIRQPGAKMLQAILEEGENRDDPAGCVVCHGGDPAATEKEAAHGGDAFFADPGSPWINPQQHDRNGCKLCHATHARVQRCSLMMTEAGKIQGVAWAFGSLTGYKHTWGNYDVANPKDRTSRLGTDRYLEYMDRLAVADHQDPALRNVFVERHLRLPDAPTDPAGLIENPELAAFTYMRNQCLRCHLGVKGRQKRGDYRGMGCSACHIPYSNEGFYEGGDQSIPRDEPGHCLVHTIQGTRDAKVKVHGHEYTGIPVETCTTCHDRGKRIGVSYQGLMETPYTTPYTEDGGGQPALHTKHYIAMHQDIHYQKGMTCQDCHTSIDVHGDGFLAAANLAAVQIECSDCHGTPRAYPWELPLGYMDEIAALGEDAPPRGTSDELPAHVRQGMKYPVRDGYLLSARGNPLANAVRIGNMVMVHTAGGKDIDLKPLKLIEEEKELSLRGLVAMSSVRGHVGKMECYTCHASWTPQCYGCHLKIDYSGGKQCFDWLAAGHRHRRPECAADRGEDKYTDLMIPGEVSEQRSYLRFEDPALGVNGESRITPVAPGCQVSVTVIGADGKPILLNRIFHTTPDSEGSGPEGQLSLDMSPLHPHTMTKDARTCESCHASDKALGYGIGSSRLTRPWDERVVVDLETADGHVLSKHARTQMAPLEGLSGDWSRLVSEDGKQLQTVGHHFQGSRPLNNQERAHIDRRGICLACHQEIPDRSLAVSLLHHVAEYTGQLPEETEQHHSLVHTTLLFAGWIQVTAMVTGPLAILGGGIWLWRRRRRRKQSGKQNQ